MRIVHSIARPARALLFGSLVAFVAAQSFGRPGDRLDRYPLLVTEPSAEVVGPSLDMDETGRFVATWASDEGQDTHVLFQRFAANGTPTGGKVRVGTASDPNDDTFVTTNVVVAADGSFTVVWAACVFPCQASGIYARRYTANGEPIGDEVLVIDQQSALIGNWGVAGAADGRFAIAWHGTDSMLSRPGSIFVRLFNSDGVPHSPPSPVVPSPTLEALHFADVAMSATGTFVVAWEDSTNNNSTHVLLGRRFDANGSALGDAFTLANPSAATRIEDADLAMRSTGEFVLALAKSMVMPESNVVPPGIYGRRFDAEGRPLGNEFQISAAQTAAGAVSLDSNAAGDFVVTWGDGGLHTRLYRASGSPATSDQRYSELGAGSGALDRVGNFVVGFARGRSHEDTGGFAPGALTMHVQRFVGYTDTRPSCARIVATLVGNDNSNTLHGGPSNDVIVANGGNDTIFAWGGDDVVCGNNGADVIYGGYGNDHLVGGAGDDLLDGGPGSRDYCNGESHTNADTAVSCEFRDNVP
jgi:hypothetical protein